MPKIVTFAGQPDKEYLITLDKPIRKGILLKAFAKDSGYSSRYQMPKIVIKQIDEKVQIKLTCQPKTIYQFFVYLCTEHPQVNFTFSDTADIFESLLHQLTHDLQRDLRCDKEAYDAIYYLQEKLYAAVREYFASEITDETSDKFVKACNKALNKVRKIIDPYPMWRKVIHMLLRVVAAVATCGLSLLVEVSVQKLHSGQWGLFGSHKNKTLKNMDLLDKMVQQHKLPTDEADDPHQLLAHSNR